MTSGRARGASAACRPGPAIGHGASNRGPAREAGRLGALAHGKRAALAEQSEGPSPRADGRAVAQFHATSPNEAKRGGRLWRGRGCLRCPPRGLDERRGAPGVRARYSGNTTVEDYREVCDLERHGHVPTMKHWLPTMIKAGAGEIVNIGGTFWLQRVSRRPLPYGATKMGLAWLNKSRRRWRRGTRACG